MIDYSRSSQTKSSIRPPDLYEYFVDNFWFRAADLNNQTINAPLKGSHNADVVIVGGGFTGLSSAYNIKKKFPNKKIVLLEGACCGYGASGRNGGFCITTEWLQGIEDSTDKEKEVLLRIASYGLEQIKHMITEYDLDCDLEENGMLEVALNERQLVGLEEDHHFYQQAGMTSNLLEQDQVREQINSPVFKAGLQTPYGAILNPAKLARGMKRVVEDLGVEVREQTIVTKITPGKSILIDTELGDISAPIAVVATNAYSHKIGLFNNRVIPVAVFQIATAPLNKNQWKSIGWKNRQGLSDLSAMFSYSRPTADGRIVFGGVNPQYYANDKLASGNDKFASQYLVEEFFRFFPQLKGLQIEHAWGGTTALTVGNKASVGTLDHHENIYYGVGYSEGVPSTQTAGRMIAELISGEINDFTNHYVVNHHMPYAGPTGLRRYFAAGAKWIMKKFDYPLYR